MQATIAPPTTSLVVPRLLDAGIAPDRILVGGTRFDDAIAPWNKEVEDRPAVVVRCLDASEVQAVVLAAAAAGLPLSVRGGGHDWAGRALREGGVVVDLSLMRSVRIEGDVASVAGGATNLDVMSAAERSGLTAAAGSTGGVGFAGLALGGGYGPLVGRFGLALDNLLGAEVVLADGRLVAADATREPDLFWALRGGGGNLGVVVSLRVRLHPITPLRAGPILFPLDQIQEVLGGYADILAAAPDDLTATAGILTAPDGSPAVFVAPTWSGDPGPGDALLDRLARLGTPIANLVSDTSYVDVLRANDGLFGARGRYAIGTRSLPNLTPEAIAALLEIGRARPSAASLINIHHFHGAAARVPLAGIAFGLRRDHLMVEIIARWSDGEAAPHHAWIRGAETALAPFALPGGYPNLLGPDRHDRFADAYGTNAARLLAVKDRYDPDGVFAAIPLPSPADLAAGARGSVSNAEPTSLTPAASDAVPAILDQLRQAINRHDLDALVACFAPDVSSGFPAHPGRDVRGQAQVRRNWAAIFGAVPDIEAELLGFAAAGETIWAEWAWEGTQGDGVPYAMRGVTVQGLRENRIVWARLFMEPVDTINGSAAIAPPRSPESRVAAV
jgi:ketosteroid isomerase-like protein